MDSENLGGKLEYQNHVAFGFEMPSDNEVSTMVDQYLSKDNLNGDDDWARVVDEAICIMSNPDHVSMAATMNSSSNHHSEVSNYNMTSTNGMFNNDQNQPTSHASLSHQNYETFYNNPPIQNHHQHQYSNEPHYQDQMYIPQDHFQHHYQNDNYYHPHHQNQGDYNNSQIYYVPQNVNKNAGPEVDPAATYQNFASLPGLNTMSVMNYHQNARTQSSSSGGNSPSSQSPVSEEEYHEPPPRALQRRPSKEIVTQKKVKGVKPRRRKKDPNEPTKPVSAYALFFRDTQATIKGTKPDASFGEVSKIVAAMWDSLDADRKTMYKKRTEEAKKDYLQQLALYRASLINSPSEPSLYLHTNNYQARSPVYNRPNIYSSGNMGQHLIKTRNVSPPTAISSPTRVGQDEMKNEGQIFARIVEPEVMSSNYLPWDTLEMERNNVVSHCKDSHMYSTWMINHQPSSPSGDNVVI